MGIYDHEVRDEENYSKNYRLGCDGDSSFTAGRI